MEKCSSARNIFYNLDMILIRSCLIVLIHGIWHGKPTLAVMKMLIHSSVLQQHFGEWSLLMRPGVQYPKRCRKHSTRLCFWRSLQLFKEQSKSQFLTLVWFSLSEQHSLQDQGLSPTPDRSEKSLFPFPSSQALAYQFLCSSVSPVAKGHKGLRETSHQGGRGNVDLIRGP